MLETQKPQIVYTLTARCRDCYRVPQAVPVKAIRMQNGQAYVDEKRCIACGTCIRNAPAGKTFRSDINVAQSLIDEGHFVAASIAPSFPAVFNKWQRSRLASALRALASATWGKHPTGHTGITRITEARQSGYDKAPHNHGVSPP
jgi:Fe-S-cluster-containing hydrogenase component 2